MLCGTPGLRAPSDMGWLVRYRVLPGRAGGGRRGQSISVMLSSLTIHGHQGPFALDGLIEDLRSGRGWPLVMRGEVGWESRRCWSTWLR
jgi:hypothetical protein